MIYGYLYIYICIHNYMLLFLHIYIYMHMHFDLWRFINTRQRFRCCRGPSTSDLFPHRRALRSCVLASCAHSSMRLWLLRSPWFVLGCVLGPAGFVSGWIIFPQKKTKGKQPVTTNTCSRVKQKRWGVFQHFGTCCSYCGWFFFPKNHWMISGSSSTKTGQLRAALSYQMEWFIPCWIHMEFLPWKSLSHDSISVFLVYKTDWRVI